MKRLKLLWNKFKYWQKGGVIGAILYSSIFAIIFLRGDTSELVIPFVPTIIIILILCGESHFPGLLPDYLCKNELGISSIISLILGFFFGALIGLIIGKIKRK
jgi:hypothetical protein